MSSTTRTVDGRRSRRTTADGVEQGGESISDDELFHLLQNSRRRAVLRYLRGREGPVRMRDVAEQVAAWEHETTVAQLTSEERQRVYIALYQSHLETLEEAGVIEYNKPRGIVDPLPLLDHVAAYIDRPVPGETDGAAEPATVGSAPGNGDRWEQRYLGVSVVGAILLVGTATDLSVLGALSSFTASVAILLTFSVLTLARMTLEGDRLGGD